MKNKFTGPFGKQIVKHLKLRRALGRDYRVNERTLIRLNALVQKKWPRAQSLTREIVQNFFKTNTHLKAISRRNEMTYIRMFAVDLASQGIETYMPERRLLPKAGPSVRVHIFSETEIGRLMRLAKNLGGRVAGVMYPTLIGVYWVTGLRLNEALSLDIGDVDLLERTIFVRSGKFGKSRLIPISETTASALRVHIAMLKKLKFGVGSSDPLFLTSRGTRLGKGMVSFTLRKLYRKAEIKTSAGNLPRTHDLRHSFATHSLKSMRQLGEDPSNMIPALAVVMGHTSLAHTQAYLHPSMETLQVASKAFGKRLARYGRGS